MAKLIMNKVDGPKLVVVYWPRPIDGAVFVIKPSALLVPLLKPQNFFTPEAFYLLMVNTTAFNAQQGYDLPIANTQFAWLASSSQCAVHYRLLIWLYCADLSGIKPKRLQVRRSDVFGF